LTLPSFYNIFLLDFSFLCSPPLPFSFVIQFTSLPVARPHSNE
jgi:hypothetical protein